MRPKTPAHRGRALCRACTVRGGLVLGREKRGRSGDAAYANAVIRPMQKCVFRFAGKVAVSSCCSSVSTP